MELFGSTSRGGFSVRSIFTSVLVVVVTAFLWVLFGSTTPAHAAPVASWSGETIILDVDGVMQGGHQYTKADPAKLDPSHKIPSGSTIYIYRDDTSTSAANRKAYIIYFTSGVDPPTATKAEYVEYNYSSSGVFSNPQNKRTIDITPAGEQSSYSSCSVDGIGWLLCPISVFLANAMDWLFDILAGLIAVQPSTLGNPNNDLFRAWSIMRNIANVAFVIAFIIIIYSQLTSVGLSNYGLKKLIPRLIIAAILVNMSFIITALAIDISNILGYSLQDLLNNIREDVFVMTNDTHGGSADSWAALTAIVLGGGALGYAAIGSAGGALYLLVPLLVGLGLTLLFVVLVLAARQAIIIILVIVAPLAFVAYLLPNTEKWFEKWRDLFMTMLIFFPAFSLVFGGSQLAGQVIIQNAGDNIIMIIFGMAVQIAPLVITPLLLKLSGGLLGRIAQIANDPRKGLLDKSRNWANDRIDMRRQENLGQDMRNRSRLNPLTWGRRALQGMDNSNRNVKMRTDLAKLRGDNRYQDQNRQYGRLHEAMAGAELDKERIHNDHNTHLEHEKTRYGSSLYDRAIRAEASKENLETGKNTTAAHFNRERQNSLSELNASTIGLEASKARLETSDNNKNAYLNRQRMMGGTILNRTVAPLEASKLRLESSNNQFTAMVENMKLNPASEVYHVAQGAEASKDMLEAAKNRVQALYDEQRRTAGTGLNLSTIEVEQTKLIAEASKSLTSAFIADEKSTVGGNLHVEFVQSERAKVSSQLADERITRIVNEYKSGALTDPAMTPQLQALMKEMQEDNARIAAEKQGTSSAQYVQQEYISKLMDENSTDPLSSELLTTAAGVDPNGRTRARANAISQLNKLEQEALTNNVTLLSDQAAKEGTTLKALAKLIFSRQTGQDLPPGEVQSPQDPSIVEAAMEALAQDGDISTLRKARMDTSIDQDMLTRLFARNSGTMKAKGGFDLQANPSLAGASREEMDISIAGTLGDVAAGAIAGQKAGWWDELSNDLPRIYNTVDTYAYDPDPAINAAKRSKNMTTLEQTYHNVTTALTSPEVLKDIGDRIEQTIKIHQYLHAQFADPAMVVDYDMARKGKA